MRQSRQAELLDRLVGLDHSKPWSQGLASMHNPASAYTDPLRFQQELEVLFRGRPQFVALTGDCRDPGTFLTITLGAQRIIVQREAIRACER